MVLWLSFPFWCLQYRLDIINFIYSFFKSRCSITVFTLCIAKAWVILWERNAFLSLLCSQVWWSVKLWFMSHISRSGGHCSEMESAYPHYPELLSDLFLLFSPQRVRISQNFSDLLQNLMSGMWIKFNLNTEHLYFPSFIINFNNTILTLGYKTHSSHWCLQKYLEW